LNKDYPIQIIPDEKIRLSQIEMLL